MKKTVKVCLALLLSFLMAVNVYADSHDSIQKPEYQTDYFMIVESPDGGINIYPSTDLGQPSLNSELIPNGTALHIEGEIEEQNNNRVWGYTKYCGMYGYVPLDDCRPASRSEAIESELYIAGHENVNYDADYEVKTAGKSGGILLYRGPGEKYGKVSGTEEIPNGEKLTITQDAKMKDGSHWGLTQFEGVEGWVNLGETELPGTVSITGIPGSNAEAEKPVMATPAAKKPAELTPTEAPKSVEVTPTEAPKPAEVTPTPAVKKTAELTPTEAPKSVKVTPTPTVEKTAELTPTEAAEKPAEVTPTEAAKATPTEKARETAGPSKPAEKAKETAGPSKPAETPEASEQEVTPTDAAQETSAKDIQTENSFIVNPFIWIAGIGLLLAILLLIYHFKKR